MKPNTFFITTIFAIFCMSTACKKSNTSPNGDGAHYVLSYEFDGDVYHGEDGNWGLLHLGTNITGITIYNADLFGGRITFTAPDCAYLNTTANEISEGPNCRITYADETPVDSSLVYIYQSGNFTSVTSNCSHKSGNDLFGYYSYELCDIDVHFSVTLVNNKGDKIEIKNGSVKGTFAF